jgi:pimeloyl-ACP methyl ester carboxylesterase
MPRLVVIAICLALASTVGLRAQETEAKKPNFDSEGVKIHYTVQGKDDGEPVLLIHGFTASEEMFAPLVKGLAKDYKVITMDCRGHGGSEKPHDPKKYGIEMIKDAVRLLDHLKIDKAHVVGYSMGGGIALQMAVRYPDRVRSLTLGGSGLPQPGREKLLESLAESLEQGKGLGPLIVALTPKDRPKPSEEQMKQIDKMLLSRNDPKALAAVLRGLAGKDLVLKEEQVKGLKMPVIAIIGEVDPLRDDVDALKKLLPSLKVVVIDKADHITAFSHELFVNGVKEFLEAQRSDRK